MNSFIDSMHLRSLAEVWAAAFSPLVLKGCLWLLVLLGLHLALRQASAALRHMVLTVGLCGLVLLPLLEVGLPSWNILSMPRAESPATAPVEIIPTVADPAVLQTDTVATKPLPASGSTMLGQTEVNTPARTSLISSLVKTPSSVWLLGIWLGGLVLQAGMLAVGLLRLWQLQRQAMTLEDPDWLASRDELCRRLSIASPPRLLRSIHALSPMTWGLRRSVILLPRDCGQWDAEQRHQVLLHELAHVQRRDCLSQAVSQLICMVYWFNPLVWVTARLMRIERERACDDAVLLAGARASSYASHLLNLTCSLRQERRTLSVSLAMARKSQISGRLVALLDPKRHRNGPGRRLRGGIALATLLVILPLAALSPAHDNPPPKKPAKAAGLAKVAEPAPPAWSVSESEAAEPAPPNSGYAYTTDETGRVLSSRCSTTTTRHSGRTVSWTINDDKSKTSIKIEGDVELSPDDARIVAMSDNGLFELKENKDGDRRSLRIESVDGELEYEYKIGRRRKPFDDEARQWLASTLPDLVRDLALGAGQRVERIYEQDGAEAVLEMIEDIESGYAQQKHLQAYLELKQLDTEERVEALDRASALLESDYEKSQLLVACREQMEQNEKMRAAGLRLTAEMDSDYTKQQVLTEMLEARDLQAGERTEILRAVSEIDSEYERGNLLKKMLDDDELDNEELREALRLVRRMDSDYEKAGILLRLADRARTDEEVREMYMDAAESIDSDHEYGRVMRAIRRNRR